MKTEMSKLEQEQFQTLKQNGLFNIPQIVLNAGYKDIFQKIVSTFTCSRICDIKTYQYIVEQHLWTVFDAPTFKATFNDTGDYHCFFSKLDGFNLRFGKTIDDDPKYCGLGFEILDLEISVNGCAIIPGSTNCKYCYKNNSNASPTNMSFKTFKQIVDSCPKNLSQIAFGITGLQTNPDFEQMLKYCREVGIIPNTTTVGADMNEHMKDVLTRYCGAIAVSCYTGAKDFCYKTIKELYDYAKEKYNRNMHINMHIVVSKDNLLHVKDVLKDIADKKVYGLKSVVFLRIKPKGRAEKMDCTVSKTIYKELITYCLDHDISFGFDSCSAIPVMNVLKELNKAELCSNCEACESGSLSGYINVHGQYWSCSFAENTSFVSPVNVLEYSNAYEWWNSENVKKIRFCKNPACQSCPIYNLDGE